MKGLRVEVVSRIGDPSTRERYADRLLDFAWEMAPNLGGFVDSLSVPYVVNRARRGSASLAERIAEETSNPQLLAELYAADRRVGVRSCVASNPHVEVGLLLAHLQECYSSGRHDRARGVLEVLTAERLMSVLSDEDTRRLIVSAYSVSLIAPRIQGSLLALPASEWASVIGSSAQSAALVAALAGSGAMSQEQACDAIMNFTVDAHSEHFRDSLARVATGGDLQSALAVTQASGWYQCAEYLLRHHGSCVDFATAAAALESRADVTRLAAKALSFSLCTTVDHVLVRTLLESANPSLGHARRFGSRMSLTDSACEELAAYADKGSESFRSLLPPLLWAATGRQLGRLAVALGPDARPPRRDMSHQFLSGGTDFGAFVEAVDEASADPSAVLWLFSVFDLKLTSRDLAPGVRARIGDHLVSALEAMPSFAIAGEVWAAWSAFLVRRSHVSRLTRVVESGCPMSTGLVSGALGAAWWDDAGPRLVPALKRLLVAVERAYADAPVEAAYWPRRRPDWYPRSLVRAPASLAGWVIVNAPGVMDFCASQFDRPRRGGLYELQAALLPYAHRNWAVTREELWDAAGVFLGSSLTSPEEWEVALGLLPEWQGSLCDLVASSQRLCA